MSVILWDAEDLGNVVAYLNGGADEWSKRCRKSNSEALAKVSVANVEEFRATYGTRHGEPVPATSSEILSAAPHHAHAEGARNVLKLLAYNAHGDDAKRQDTLEALVGILTAALQLDT